MPRLGVAVVLPDQSWSVCAIVSGVVLTALRGDRGELFGGTWSSQGAKDGLSGSASDRSLEPMPVLGLVKKPLEVSDTMPIRQTDGMYSWESIAVWAAPPLPNEAPKETFFLDDCIDVDAAVGFEQPHYQLREEYTSEVDIKPMTGVDNRPPTAYLRIEFDDELELEDPPKANPESPDRFVVCLFFLLLSPRSI